MKKKGFTLVELIAVILILGVIALILVPTVTKIIKTAKINSAIASANGYMKALNNLVDASFIKGDRVEAGTYDVANTDLNIKYTGTSPTHGNFVVENDKVMSGNLCINGYSIAYDGEKSTYEENGSACPTPYKFIEPEGTITSDLCNGSTYEVGNFKIKTAEDLVCLSKQVNAGNKFKDSTIMLLSDIDINKDSSYKDIDDITYGDINGNGVIEGLKIELTTGKGFNPIGKNDSNYFSGTFEGYAFTISNLYINRPSQDYIGLFGYADGATIKGINLKGIDYVGSSYTGGLIGYSKSTTVNESFIIGSITAQGYVGGVIGYKRSGNSLSNIVDIDIKARSSVGGLIGRAYSSSSTTGLIIGGSIITNSTSTSPYVSSGIGDESNNQTFKGYVSNSFTITNTAGGGIKGDISASKYNPDSIDNILNFADGVIDTYIGGDSDSSGYYFDYDTKGNILIYNTSRDPINLNLEGEGTLDKPYIIDNVADWKNAVSTVKSGSYYILNSNLDFEGESFYPMGTSGSYFNGYFDGNGKTIKNVNINSASYASIFGYNTGTIENINFENITITASSYIGLVGYNTGTIKGINASDIIVTGTSYVGGLAGYNIGTITDINLSGTITGSNEYIGGLVGDNDYKIENALVNADVSGVNYVGGVAGSSRGGSSKTSYLYAIMDGGSVAGTTNVGRISGYTASMSSTGNYSVFSGYGSSDIVYTSIGGSYNYFYNGSTFSVSNDMITYDRILDTYMSGDNDSSGYYFDFDSLNDMRVYSIKDRKLENTLVGEGTLESPYLIDNVSDWKNATITSKTGVYYKLTSDIDFKDQKFFPLGTINNYFTSTLDGNDKTISNINIKSFSYSGMIGYSTGTVKNLYVDNFNVSGGQYVGLIGYQRTGTLQSIQILNETLKGSGYVGGLAGYSESAIIKENLISGSITSTGSYTGGLVGKRRSGEASSNIVDADIVGTNDVGGMIGYSYYSYLISGAVIGGSITSTSIDEKTNAAKVLGRYYSNVSNNAYVSNAVTLTNTAGGGTTGAINGTTYDASNPDVLTILNSKIDTYIDGDNNSTGHYFNYDTDGNIRLFPAS